MVQYRVYWSGASADDLRPLQHRLLTDETFQKFKSQTTNQLLLRATKSNNQNRYAPAAAFDLSA